MRCLVDTRCESVPVARDSFPRACHSRWVQKNVKQGLRCTGYKELHSGFNGGPEIASAVILACTGWLSYALEEAAQRGTKITIHVPFGK